MCDVCYNYDRQRNLNERIKGMETVEKALKEMESFEFSEMGCQAVRKLIGTPKNKLNDARAALARAKLYVEHQIW